MKAVEVGTLRLVIKIYILGVPLGGVSLSCVGIVLRLVSLLYDVIW